MGKKNEAARMLANLNGPWSNAACMGYCLIAMRRANLRPGAQRRVLMVLEQCFDDVSVEDAEKAVYKVLSSDVKQPTVAELLADKDASPIKVAGETVQKSGLETNKDYVVVAAASYGETVSKLVTQTFKTEGITFTVDMSQITWNSAKYKITPSKEGVTYVTICAKKSDMATYAGKDNEFMEVYITYLDQLLAAVPDAVFADMLDTNVKEGTFTG